MYYEVKNKERYVFFLIQLFDLMSCKKKYFFYSMKEKKQQFYNVLR